MQTLAGIEKDYYILSETIADLEDEHQKLIPQYQYLCQQTRFTGIPENPTHGGSNLRGGFKRSLLTLFIGYYIGFYPGYFLKEKFGHVGLMIAVGIYVVFSILVLARNSSRTKKARMAEWEQETARMKAAFQNMENLKLEVQEAIPEIEDRVKLLKEALASCEEVRQHYYDLGVLHKKYRGYVPVLTMLQYLKTKRTYSLERDPHNNDPGAFNMYEEELYHQQIIGELQQINQNLELVQMQQAMLYDAYCEGNQKIAELTEVLSQGVETLHRDNQIAEYSRLRIAENTERMKNLAEYAYSRSLV